MYVTTGLAGPRDTISASLAKERGRLTSEILLRSTYDAERTLGLQLFADALVERYAAAIANDEWSTLPQWIAGFCERQSDLDVVKSIAFNAGRTIASTVDALKVTAPGLAAELQSIERLVLRTIDEQRAARRHASAQAVEEVDVVIDELIHRLEAENPATAEHSRAVSAWCARIARRMTLSKTDALYVARAGLVHDVGKIAVPPHILNAARCHDAAERELMREHVIHGEQMVRKIPQLHAFAAPVRSHHERVDGRGYPDGSAAKNIPLTTRVVTVADAFNAMIGRRPYRAPMSPMRAIEELDRNRGAQFDPDVVDAMIDVVMTNA